MPLTLIHGQFRIVGGSPDGDSVRFYPTDPSVWDRAGIRVRPNGRGGVQLRLDAIDALETHFTPRSSPHPWRQNPALGEGAGDALLDLLGFTGVVRDAAGTVTAATPEARPGAILTRFADKYGRAVAFAFPDGQQPAGPDGGQVFLGTAGLVDSLNHWLLADGWVYPIYYSKLFPDLREELTTATLAACTAGSGVWAADSTLNGFTLQSRDQLTADLVILPKLFRRLAEYLTLDDTGGVDLVGFPAFLDAKADRLFTIRAGHATHLDTLITVTGQQLQLILPPEQIVFIEG